MFFKENFEKSSCLITCISLLLSFLVFSCINTCSLLSRLYDNNFQKWPPLKCFKTIKKYYSHQLLPLFWNKPKTKFLVFFVMNLNKIISLYKTKFTSFLFPSVCNLKSENKYIYINIKKIKKHLVLLFLDTWLSWLCEYLTSYGTLYRLLSLLCQLLCVQCIHWIQVLE